VTGMPSKADQQNLDTGIQIALFVPLYPCKRAVFDVFDRFSQYFAKWPRHCKKSQL